MKRDIQCFNTNKFQERITTEEGVDLSRMKGATPLQNIPDAQIHTPNNNTKKHEEKLTELKDIV